MPKPLRSSRHALLFAPFCLALTGVAPAAAAAGAVVGWGLDNYGQATPPKAVNGAPGTAIAIEAGIWHSCAIQEGTGAVICWGENSRGQRAAPDAVNGVSGTAAQISSGDWHSCAVQEGTGVVVCWGWDLYGQSTPPDAVNGVSGTASEVSAGYEHSCAIQAGTAAVVCWGGNTYGQSIPPDAVNGVSGTASAISAGLSHSCAIQAGTDEVICWGWNFYGQSAPPDAVNGVAGTATEIAAGGNHSCAIQTGMNYVVCWGRDDYGQVASISPTARATGISAGRNHNCALRLGSNGAFCWGDGRFGQSTPPDAVNGVAGIAAKVAAGQLHSCAIQAGTGAVVCWGSGSSGQSTPPESVNGPSGIATEISAGSYHGCAIQAGTGEVICWGRDNYGQATPPDAVNGMSGTAAGLAAGALHNCAIQAGTGAVVCWGRDSYGQATPPAAVDGTSGTATEIAAGQWHSCAIQAGTGSVICWGDDFYAQSTPPAAVDGTSGTASRIAAGQLHSCAIQAAAGAVVCWGDDSYGQSTPPAAVDGTSGTASRIAAGQWHSCALQAGTGAVVCWGLDGHGQSTPPDAVNGTSGTATGIAAGQWHSCAIQSGTGAVVCWGRDNYAQVTPPGDVDGTSGTATGVAAGDFHTLAIVSLPEPAAWLTQAAGLALLCALGRLRARKRVGRAGPPGGETSMSRTIAQIAPALLVAVLVFAPSAARAGLKLFTAEWFTESFGNECQGTLTPNGLPAPHCPVATGEFAAYSNYVIPQGILCNPFAPRCPFSSTPTDGYGFFHPLGGSGNPTMTSSIFCAPLSQYGAGITVRPAKGQTASRRVPPLYRNPAFFTSGGQPKRTACDARSTGYATATQTRFGANKGRVQRGMPVAGTSIASTTRSGGFGIFPYAIRTTGRAGQFNVQYPLIYSYTYATLRNNDGTFGPGQGPGSFNIRYTDAAATVASINVKQGAAKFGGTMRMLGSLTNKVFCWFEGYWFGSIGTVDWRYDAVGAPAPTSEGVVTRGYIATAQVIYRSTAAFYLGYRVRVVGARFPWTTGSVTVTAVGRGPHRTVHYAHGYDNRTPTSGYGTIQMVSPLLTRWLGDVAFETGGIGVLRIRFVPEPQGWMMLVAGIALLCAGKRLRGRRADH